MTVEGSKPPRGPGEVVIDKHSADVGHFTAGDTVRVLTAKSPAVYTITGIATWGSVDSPLGATIAAFDPATAARVLGCSASPARSTSSTCKPSPGCRRTPW